MYFKKDFSGIVQKGIQKGKKLGFPTINILINNAIKYLEHGVFVCHTLINNKIYEGSLHFGPKSIGNPYKNNAVFCEIHLIDFNEDIYGKEVEVQVLKKIRNVRKFNSEQDLINVIENDVNETRNYFK